MKKLLLILMGLSLFTIAEAKTPTKFKVHINGKDLDSAQYSSLKADRIAKVRNMRNVPLKWDEVRDWVEMAQVELQGCPITLHALESIITVINNKMEQGCL